MCCSVWGRRGCVSFILWMELEASFEGSDSSQMVCLWRARARDFIENPHEYSVSGEWIWYEIES